MTKQEKIMAALDRGERLTHYKALAYGTTRLAAYIHRIRGEGVDVAKETKTDVNGVRFAEYYIPSRAA